MATTRPACCATRSPIPRLLGEVGKPQTLATRIGALASDELLYEQLRREAWERTAALSYDATTGAVRGGDGVSAPSVTAVVATLNAARRLAECLQSVRDQEYDGDVTIIVADGGSHDATVDIARAYGATVVPNPLRTGEAGKAAGVRAAAGPYLVLLVDSDNTLVGRDWAGPYGRAPRRPQGDRGGAAPLGVQA